VVSFNPSNNALTYHENSGNTFTNTNNLTLGPDNCFYALPYRFSDFILKFDPSDNSFTEIAIDLSINADDKRWDFFTVGPDGVMHIPPTVAGTSSCGCWYNPFTGEWGNLTGYTTNVGDAFFAGTPHPSGSIVFGPSNDKNTVVVVNTDTKTTSNYDKTASMEAAQKAIQLAANGNIYGFPRWTSNSEVNQKIWKIELGEEMPLDTHFTTSIYIDA